MSYARLITFNLDAGQRAFAEGIADKFAAMLQSQQGFLSISFFIDEASGEYASISHWETKADAEKSYQSSAPRLQEATAGMLKSSPTFKLYEVYEAKV
ncbi:MAG: antibiotic biosynthesis monooxygenase [Thiolinea sp.]